jgi:cysteinyl-tRNA synthetase
MESDMQLYNTLSRTKETFQPVEGRPISIYACGITAYDLSHIGHARAAVTFDILVRYLRHRGQDVTFIRNFTDIDDKIIKRANEVGEAWDEIARRYMDAFHEDMDALHVNRADIEPLCTGHIPEMIALTEQLIDMGHAYATPSGDVYFKVRSFPEYGKLSGRDIEEMKAGARIKPGEEKQDPLDFALWKGVKPGEPSWESPWGQGRPGWHLECSAMAAKYVELPLDIHAGGQDLIFPHHENEIAQSEAATGEPLARYWVHNGFLQINSEKMSKSLGNFFTIRDILDKFQPETLRYFLVSKHYRSPLDFSFEAMEEAEKALRRVYAAKEHMIQALDKAKWSKAALPDEMIEELDACETGFEAAMEDDLNTGGAIGHVFNAVRLAGRILEDKSLRKSEGARDTWTRILEDLKAWSSVLGVLGDEPGAFLRDLRAIKAKRREIDVARVEQLLAARAEARKNKDFARSDELRDEIAALGVTVKDTPAGQEWDVE